MSNLKSIAREQANVIHSVHEGFVEGQNTPFPQSDIGKATQLEQNRWGVIISPIQVVISGVVDVHFSECTKLVRGGWEIIGFGDQPETIRLMQR